MFEIPLVGGRGVVLIDAADVPLVEEHSWYLHGQGYACTQQGRVLMHRLVLAAAPGSLVDHRDGDKLNNRRANLRLTDYSLNAFNRSQVDSRSSTGVPGVSPRGRQFGVYIFRQGKRIYIGMGADLLAAARLRAQAEYDHYGEVTPATRAALDKLEG